ncbi:unnamed protein product [Penicillium roqueforti FM164]|uniref:Genomic scaffold, ProqFM164S03 n=1 Tax=Penicillium roqueforti (strain FM164) TaxID=1365484 RepID=W6QDB4_PENRF|nr:unnamed protein product [Penicillium roqueforti FM164]
MSDGFKVRHQDHRGFSDGANHVPDQRFNRSIALWGAIGRGVPVGAQNIRPNTGCSAFRVMSSASCSLRDLEFASVVMLRVCCC